MGLNKVREGDCVSGLKSLTVSEIENFVLNYLVLS